MIIFMLQILYIIAIDNLLLLFKENMHVFQFKIIIPPTSDLVSYIRVTGNSKEIPILNSNCSVVLLTQVNEGESISFIYTIRLYGGFAIHSVISLLSTKTFNTFTNTEIV